ncbi:MAG: hypothetical protein L6W00_08850 [Lentisphaeria bacterium]|nr:MAG: hypothetical protein L6W00_08850 [Lentisphaeria bacterium]
MPERKFQAALPDCMQALFHLSRCRDIKRPGTDGRWTNRSGYRNIKNKEVDIPRTNRMNRMTKWTFGLENKKLFLNR